MNIKRTIAALLLAAMIGGAAASAQCIYCGYLYNCYRTLYFFGYPVTYFMGTFNYDASSSNMWGLDVIECYATLA
jgi:hypothetical protein